MRITCACLLTLLATAVLPAAEPKPAEVLDGVRTFFARAARDDGTFRPGIDPNYPGMSDSAASDLAPTVYAVILHKTFGWPLPNEEKTRAFLLGRQKPDGSFVNVARPMDPSSPHARLHTPNQAL